MEKVNLHKFLGIYTFAANLNKDEATGRLAFLPLYNGFPTDPSVVYRLLSTVFCLLSTVYCLLCAVCCLLSTVYCLLSTVYL